MKKYCLFLMLLFVFSVEQAYAAITLSNISFNATSPTSATITATSNTSGTMYYVVTTSSTAPSSSQVKSGKTEWGVSAPFSGNSSVSSSAAKSFDITGLTGTQYYGYVVVTNGGSTSNVYSTGVFTPNNIRSFSVARQENITGGIALIGNSNIVGGANNQCPGDNVRNNDIYAVYANIDKAHTTNSSSATLSIPAGSTVKWAGLYWQGYVSSYSSSIGNVKFKAPGMSSYASLSSDVSKLNWIYFDTDRLYYQGAIEVTNYVKSAGSGTYVVGDITTQTGQPVGGSFGAWSLIVVYQNSSETLKNLTVFDGYQGISSSDSSKPNVYASLSIPLSGFLTPISGNVDSTFYMFTGEGDIGAAGDSVSLTDAGGSAHYLYDSLNPYNDIMNSTITKNGNYVTARNPSCQNTIGIDIDSFSVGTTSGALGIIGNNQTSTTATFTSSGDGYFPGIAAFATQLYVPDVCYDETVTIYRNGTEVLGPAQVNDVIVSDVMITNNGNQQANSVTVSKFFDNTITSYSPGTMYLKAVGSSAGYIYQTDADDSDNGKYLSGDTYSVNFYLGNVAKNAKGYFRYSTLVKSYTTTLSENTYFAGYTNTQLGVTFAPTQINKCSTFNNTIPVKNQNLLTSCGYFTNAFSTRGLCASGDSTISFTNSGTIFNGGTSLDTCSVSQYGWISNTCYTGNCQASGNVTQSLSVIYDNAPTVYQTPFSAGSPDVSVASGGSVVLTNSGYDTVSTQWGSTKVINFTPSTQSLYVNSISLTDNTTSNMTAANNIRIGSLSINQSNTMSISAPYVQINSLSLGNGSSNAVLTIKADQIDIGSVSLGQNGILKVEPYTSGGTVLFRANSIDESSSSQFSMSSGDYYTKTLNIPGTSNSSSLYASNSNQVVNLLINGSFNPGNNPGINSAGNNGTFGSLPSTSMRIFINGDLNTGGGGTTFNAILYVEGNVVFGNPTYLKGALSAGGSITLGTGAFYFDTGVNSQIYGDCTSTLGKASNFNCTDKYISDITKARLYTKIAGNIDFDVVALKSNGTQQKDYATNGDKTVTVELVDGSSNASLSPQISQTLTFTATDIGRKSIVFANNVAYSNLRVKIVDNTDSGNPITAYSTDTFTIRPQYLSVSNNAMPILQKAGDNANLISINTDTAGYNQSLSNLTYSISKWLAIDGSYLSSTPNVNNGLAIGGTTFNSATGNSTDAVFTFPDVGRFKVDVNDTNWAAGSGDIVNGDCLTTPSTYSAANTKDPTTGKYGCYVMLNPQNGIDLRFYPYQFALTNVGLANYGNGYTYIGANEASSAYVLATVTAQNKNGDVTKNYSSGLYERAITVTPMLKSVSTSLNASSFFKALTATTVGFNSGSYAFNQSSGTMMRLNFDKSISSASDPLTLSTNATSNASNIELDVSDADNVTGAATSGTSGIFQTSSANFLYGRVYMPNAIVDYNSAGAGVRSYVEVYATDSSKLPSGTTWSLAPGSSTWYTNSLDSSTSLAGQYIRSSNILDNTGNLTNYNVSAGASSAGVITANISMPNQDQKVMLHLDVPAWLWYSSAGNAYSFAINSYCTQHPCAQIEIFGNANTDWFGSGDVKGQGAVQTAPKGKKKPRANW